MLEAGIILNVGRRGKLSARLIAFEHNGRKVGAGCVERGGQPSRAGTNDKNHDELRGDEGGYATFRN